MAQAHASHGQSTIYRLRPYVRHMAIIAEMLGVVGHPGKTDVLVVYQSRTVPCTVRYPVKPASPGPGPCRARFDVEPVPVPNRVMRGSKSSQSQSRSVRCTVRYPSPRLVDVGKKVFTAFSGFLLSVEELAAFLALASCSAERLCDVKDLKEERRKKRRSCRGDATTPESGCRPPRRCRNHALDYLVVTPTVPRAGAPLSPYCPPDGTACRCPAFAPAAALSPPRAVPNLVSADGLQHSLAA